MTLNIYCQKLIQKKFPIPEKLYIHVRLYSMETDGVNKYIVPNNYLCTIIIDVTILIKDIISKRKHYIISVNHHKTEKAMQEGDKKKQEIDRMIAEVANEDGTIAAKDFFNLCKKVFKEDIDAMDEALAKAACDDDERAEENNC